MRDTQNTLTMSDRHPFSEKIIDYNRHLDFHGALPPGVRVMNPYRDNESAFEVSSAFYRKYYADTRPRHLVMGINPGRFGAGQTGIPFTDTVRLRERCGITGYTGPETRELSSAFVYDFIDQYGGEERFYGQCYFNSLLPLGLVAVGRNGREVNCNYYDSRELLQATEAAVLDNLRTLLDMGFATDICYCLGTGKNSQCLHRLNARHGFFGEIITLEHPRYIMQYKLRSKQLYIDKYLEAFKRIDN